MRNKQILTGTCVCPGEVRGIIRKYQKGIKYNKKDIIILDEWLTKGISVLKKAGGLLSSRGGLTCHASIIAREFNIPCLVSVKGLGKLKEGDSVYLDAAVEEFTILERRKS